MVRRSLLSYLQFWCFVLKKWCWTNQSLRLKENLLFNYIVLFRFVSFRFDWFCFGLFRFVWICSFRLDWFRFVPICYVSFLFVSVFVLHCTGTLYIYIFIYNIYDLWCLCVHFYVLSAWCSCWFVVFIMRFILKHFKCLFFWLHGYCGEWEGWARKAINHTSLVAVVTPSDRPKSVRNRCVIERFGGVFLCSQFAHLTFLLVKHVSIMWVFCLCLIWSKGSPRK